MRQASHSLVLSAVNWQIFATLTYRDEPGKVETAILHGRLWLERVRDYCGFRSGEFLWYIRPERGGVGGRLHLHVLLSVRRVHCKAFFPHPGRAPWAHTAWGRGMTKFRMLHDKHDPAVAYVEKEIRSWHTDSYELQRSAEALYGVPSPALLRRAGTHVVKDTVAGEDGGGVSALPT